MEVVQPLAIEQGLTRVPVIALTANAMKSDRHLRPAVARPRRVVGLLHVRPQTSPVGYPASGPVVQERGQMCAAGKRLDTVPTGISVVLSLQMPSQPACGG
jgi:hypothetical protein